MTGSDLKLQLTLHAVERYRERVKPAVSKQAARRELELLLDGAELADHPPAWKPPSPNEAAFYAELSDGIAAAISASGRVVTIVTRSSLPPEMRKNRNAKKRSVRQQRRHQRTDRGGRPATGIEEEPWR